MEQLEDASATKSKKKSAPAGTVKNKRTKMRKRDAEIKEGEKSVNVERRGRPRKREKDIKEEEIHMYKDNEEELESSQRKESNGENKEIKPKRRIEENNRRQKGEVEKRKEEETEKDQRKREKNREECKRKEKDIEDLQEQEQVEDSIKKLKTLASESLKRVRERPGIDKRNEKKARGGTALASGKASRHKALRIPARSPTKVQHWSTYIHCWSNNAPSHHFVINATATFLTLWLAGLWC